MNETVKKTDSNLAGERIQDNSIDVSTSPEISAKKLSEAFERIITMVADDYPVRKSVLIIREQVSGKLAAVSTWEHGHVRDGLTLTLPSEQSLFEEVMAQGAARVECLDGEFAGNFFERKLLSGNNVGFAVLQPLTLADKTVGLVGFSLASISDSSTIDCSFYANDLFALAELIDQSQSG